MVNVPGVVVPCVARLAVVWVGGLVALKGTPLKMKDWKPPAPKYL